MASPLDRGRSPTSQGTDAEGPGAKDTGAEATDVRLAMALAATGAGFWDYGVSDGEVTCDQRLRAMIEVAPDAAISWDCGFPPGLHSQDRARVDEALQMLISDGVGGRLKVDCRVIGAKTGQERCLSLDGQCLPASDGGLRLVGIARDVTQERQAADALLKIQSDLEGRVAKAVAERQIWADMFEGSDDPIVAIDPDMRLIALNGAYRALCQKLFGVTLSLGDHLHHALDHRPLVRDVAESLWRRALAGEVVEIPKTQALGFEGVWYELTIRPLYGREGQLIGAYQHVRDISARVRDRDQIRQAERALRRAQKMESIGQLTGGVAHDFNNLLQVVGGNLHLLMSDLEGNAEAEARIEMALSGVARGAKLAAQLLAFGRRQTLEPRVVALTPFLEGLDDLLRQAVGEAVEFVLKCPDGLWNTQVDPGQLENALLNLAINARDAMGSRGRLTLEASNVVLDGAQGEGNEEINPGPYVMLAVSDTGCGMDADTLERVFEPFFSTKPEGSGTGLGLSMVYGFVKQSGGHVRIDSEVGQGATVRLYLPQVLAAAPAIEPAANGPPPMGEETILVVEDDEDVRATVVAMLQGLGYKVAESQEASAALEMIESGLEVDLLFTDVIMPGALRSTDLARLAQNRRPGLPVLFTSGYTQSAIVHGGRLDPGVALLSKPYTREALAHRLRQVLKTPSVAPKASSSETEAPTKRAGGATNSRAEGATATILLVEDDGLIRLSTATMLQDLGYRVIEAETGEAALRLLEDQNVQVMMVDLTLPGLSGAAVAEVARAGDPRLPIIFATGTTLTEPSLDGAVRLSKPYSPQDLKVALRQVLPA